MSDIKDVRKCPIGLNWTISFDVRRKLGGQLGRHVGLLLLLLLSGYY